MKPYDRPDSSARARMLFPESYFLRRSTDSFARVAPVIRAPFFRSATSIASSAWLALGDNGSSQPMITHQGGKG